MLAEASSATAVMDTLELSFLPALNKPKKSELLSSSSASFTFSLESPRLGSTAVDRIDSMTSAFSPLLT